jgi:hypothetical protein
LYCATCDVVGLDSSSCFPFPNILKKILWICMQKIILKPHVHFSCFPLHSLLISHLSTQGNQKINLYGIFERE